MRTLDKIKELKNKKEPIIKNCPICGSKPAEETSSYDPWGDGAGNVTDYWLECSGCGIIKSGRYTKMASENIDDVRKEITEDWNEVVDYLNKKIIKEEKQYEYKNSN